MYICSYMHGQRRYPAYLWGIETTNVWRTWYYTALVSSLPMRNWNLLSCLLEGISPFVSSLPMRNWNPEQTGLFVKKYPKYPAYLWGIETSGEAPHANSLRMYPAYLWGIETNLPLLLPFLPALRIQPTYEELKPKTNSGIGNPGISIQPTYEELKRWIASVKLATQTVSSLPMRNWNAADKLRNRCLIKSYPAYLWGIET